MWRMLLRVPIGLLLLSLALMVPATGRAHEPERVMVRAPNVVVAPRKKIAHTDGRDIVFAAEYFRRTGQFYSENTSGHYSGFGSRGRREEETIRPISQHIYTIRPNGTGLRRIIFGTMACETPRWSPDGTRIVFVGDGSLYLVNADGSGRVRLTWGAAVDSGPRWSPDGKAVLFMRDVVTPDVLRNMKIPRRSSLPRICLVTVPRTGCKPGALQTICVPPQELGGPDKFAFSPDGRWIAVQAGGPYISATPTLFLFDRRSGTMRAYPHVASFAWAPDSGRLYLTGSDGIDRMLNVATGGRTVVPHPVLSAVWIDDGHLLGMMNPRHSTDFVGADTNTVRTIESAGRIALEADLTPGASFVHFADATDEKLETDEIQGDYGCVWHPLHAVREALAFALLVAEHHMSDGEHFCVYRVDLGTGVYRYLHAGEFFGMSPNRRLYLTENTDWVGPYKRGGARVGPLEIVDARTGRARSLTRKVTVIHGADWRGGGEQ